jgi:hypothetical protein
MGSKLLKVRNGDVAEYVANLILSKIAFTTFIPRQEDFGVDFYCGLMREKDEKLYFDLPFLLQVKSNKNPITYGILPHKKGETTKRWDKESVEALFNLNLPFFIAFVDTDLLNIEIYSTSRYWQIVKEYKKASAVEFRFPPETNGIDRCIVNQRLDFEVINHWEAGNGDGQKYIVDLQQPILSFQYQDLKDDDKIQNITKILNKIIKVELMNITYNNTGLPYYKWLHKYKTNDSNIEFGWVIYDKEVEINNPTVLIEKIREHLYSLAVGYKENGMESEYDDLCKITRLIKDKTGFENLFQKYPELS